MPARERVIVRQGSAPGAAATVAVSSTTTLSAGQPASVTNIGDQYNARLEFHIPKGDTTFVGNVDGGKADSVFGGVLPLDGGGV